MVLKIRRTDSGLFVVFEGIDGCGKTTQADLFHEVVRKRFVSERGREPGTTVVGENLRKILQDPAKGELEPMTEALLFIAARCEYVKQTVAPALDAKKLFESDRFMDSTKAYQGYGRDVDLKLIDRLNGDATFGVRPNLVYLLDIEVSDAIENVKKQGKGLDKIESRGPAYFEKVRQGYLEIAGQEPERFRVIPYQKGKPEAMHAQIMQYFDEYMKTFDKSKLIPMNS